MNSHQRVVHAIADERWAILPSKLDEICEVARLWAAGADITPYQAKDKPEPSTVGTSIAVLPVFGVIARRANMMTEFSGGMSIERFTKQFRQAIADPEIGSIILDVDSPGGGVFGVDELAEEIFAARQRKRIIAIANPIAASAAYWLASAAGELVVTPSGEAGSIGVYAIHQDFSKANEMLGVAPTYISAGKFKTEGNPDAPLSDEARAHMQADIDRYYKMFTAAVARGRGVKREAVVNDFGQGRMLGAKEAVAAGMADWVGTIDDVIDRLAKGVPAVAKRAADLAVPVEAIAAQAEDELRARMFWAREHYE